MRRQYDAGGSHPLCSASLPRRKVKKAKCKNTRNTRRKEQHKAQLVDYPQRSCPCLKCFIKPWWLFKETCSLPCAQLLCHDNHLHPHTSVTAHACYLHLLQRQIKCKGLTALIHFHNLCSIFFKLSIKRHLLSCGRDVFFLEKKLLWPCGWNWDVIPDCAAVSPSCTQTQRNIYVEICEIQHRVATRVRKRELCVHACSRAVSQDQHHPGTMLLPHKRFRGFHRCEFFL